jgi:hypothetical protein
MSPYLLDRRRDSAFPDLCLKSVENANLRFVDLVVDGRANILMIEYQCLILYSSLGQHIFESAFCIILLTMRIGSRHDLG